jgi:hypothetical protein
MALVTLAGGPNWAAHEQIATVTSALLPLMIKVGIATAEEAQVTTLERRLREETVGAAECVHGARSDEDLDPHCLTRTWRCARTTAETVAGQHDSPARTSGSHKTIDTKSVSVVVVAGTAP